VLSRKAESVACPPQPFLGRGERGIAVHRPSVDGAMMRIGLTRTATGASYRAHADDRAVGAAGRDQRQQRHDEIAVTPLLGKERGSDDSRLSYAQRTEA